MASNVAPSAYVRSAITNTKRTMIRSKKTFKDSVMEDMTNIKKTSTNTSRRKTMMNWKCQ